MTRGDDSPRNTRIVTRGLVIGALVAALALSGIATVAIAASRPHTTTQTVLTSYSGKRGQQLVVEMNGQKLALYNHQGPDSPGKSTCNGACAKTWYPLIDHGKIVFTKGSGINTKQIKTFHRTDGSVQIEYYGQPLYRCRKNTKTGQIYGADSYTFGGSWGVMGTTGSPLPPAGYGGGKKVPNC